MEPTFYEKEYLNIIKTLEEELAQNKTIDPEDHRLAGEEQEARHSTMAPHLDCIRLDGGG